MAVWQVGFIQERNIPTAVANLLHGERKNAPMIESQFFKKPHQVTQTGPYTVPPNLVNYIPYLPQNGLHRPRRRRLVWRNAVPLSIVVVAPCKAPARGICVSTSTECITNEAFSIIDQRISSIPEKSKEHLIKLNLPCCNP